MPKAFSEPLDEGLRILTDYDTKTIQIAKEGTCTGYKGNQNEYNACPEDEILTYQYLEVDRDLCGAGGEEYVRDIMDGMPNGRLYKKLRKMVQGWEGRGSIGDQLYEVARHKLAYCTQKDELAEFNEFLTEFMILEQAVDVESRRALALRRKIREEMDDDFFGRETLYHYAVLNQRHMCDIRNLLAFVRRDSLFGDDGRTRDDQIWEIQKHFEALPGVPDFDGLEPICVSLGAVSPDSLPEKSIASAIRSSGDERWDPKDPHYQDMVLDALISYGARAMLEEQFFLDERDGVEWARKVYLESRIMLGFQLDRTANRAGWDGWTFLKGGPTREEEPS